MSRQIQRHLVLVIVVLVVRTQTQENRQVTVLQRLRVVDGRLRMGEHLQTLVPTQVVCGRFVHRPGIRRGKIRYLHRQRLLVLLEQLGLAGIEHTTHARRQHIIHRLALAILLDIHGGYHDLPVRLRRNGRIRQILLVRTPIAPHQLERPETQHGRFLETGHVHTHETNRLEIADRAYRLLEILDRDLEQVPFHRFPFPVHQSHLRRSLIHDVILAYLQVLRADRHLVLKIFLRLVQRIILVDILHIRRTLPRGGVSLLRLPGIAFRSIVAFITG